MNFDRRIKYIGTDALLGTLSHSVLQVSKEFRGDPSKPLVTPEVIQWMYFHPSSLKCKLNPKDYNHMLPKEYYSADEVCKITGINKTALCSSYSQNYFPTTRTLMDGYSPRTTIFYTRKQVLFILKYRFNFRNYQELDVVYNGGNQKYLQI